MSSSPRKRPASEAIIAGGAVLLLVAVVGFVLLSPAGNALFPPPPATDRAHAVSQLYNIVFGLAVVVFVAVEGLIIWSILRYRRRPGDVDLPPQTHGNNLVEAIWTLIPTAIVLYMFAVSWQTLNQVDAVSANPDVHINAVAGQFQWSFQYLNSDGQVLATQTRAVGEAGGMAVPVGRKVYVTLESRDVIHAWYVPRFLFKRDVVPGQLNHFEFTVDQAEAGQTFHGQCAELCGAGHRAMLFDVVAMDAAGYDAWLAALVEKANATPPPAPSGAATLNVVAKGIAFDKHDLEAQAGAPFVIDFKNQDPEGLFHDIDLKGADGSVIQNQEQVNGGDEAPYQYTPLEAGTYTFFCSVHPGVAAMEGTLTVK